MRIRGCLYQNEFRNTQNIMSKHSLRRLHVTLIETLIVISLIALIAGVVSINAVKAMNYQRFTSEVAEFTDRLRLAQNLMLIAGQDVHFKIQANESEKEIAYWIETNQFLEKSFESFIKKKGRLKAIKHIAHASGKDGIIDLKFLSGGSVMSSGNIQISTKSHDKKKPLIANIMLKGYPSPIYSTTGKKVFETIDQTEDNLITEKTYAEIQMIATLRQNASSQ